MAASRFNQIVNSVHTDVATMDAAPRSDVATMDAAPRSDVAIVNLRYYDVVSHNEHRQTLKDVLCTPANEDSKEALEDFVNENEIAVVLFRRLPEFFRLENINSVKLCEDNPGHTQHYLVAEFLRRLSDTFLGFSEDATDPLITIGLEFLSAAAIDGRVVMDEENTRVIALCKEYGIDAPYYCVPDDFGTALHNVLKRYVSALPGVLKLPSDIEDLSTIIKQEWNIIERECMILDHWDSCNS